MIKQPWPMMTIAQPVKPERLKFIKRFLIYEREHGLLKVIPEAPNRSQGFEPQRCEKLL